MPTADADRLCRWLHDEIERHPFSITELPVDAWNIHARIEEQQDKATKLAFENLFTLLGRPESGGRQMLRRTMATAVRAGLFFTALSIIDKLLSRRHHADHFRAWLGCGLIGIGVFGAVAAGGLLLLPSRCCQAEQQGLDLVRLFGVKSVSGIRFVACGLLAISVLFGLAPGIYWLFFE